jgi:hypothetical protein
MSRAEVGARFSCNVRTSRSVRSCCWLATLLAASTLLISSAATPVSAHPPYGGAYGPGHWGGGYGHHFGGGFSSHRSFYSGFGGFGGTTLSINGIGVVYGTQYPSGTLYAPGYFGGYPQFGWSNVGGLNHGYGAIGGYVVAPYPAYGNAWAPQPYGYYQPVVPQPDVYYPQSPLVHPGITGPTPFNNPVIQEWLPENQRPADQFAGAPIPDPVAIQPKVVDIVPRPSNLEAKRKSIRLEAMGDQAFARRDWADAYQRFKQAAEQANDRSEPRQKMAFTMLAQGLYGMAALEFKRAVAIDRHWPRTGASLDEIFGPNSELLRNNMLHRLAGWVREDIRDPDRLFVMGVVLHFNRESDKAIEFLRTAAELTQGAAHITAFLEPKGPSPVAGPVIPAGAEVPAPSLPAPLPAPGASAPRAPNRLPTPQPGLTPIQPRIQSPTPAPAPAPVEAPQPAEGPTLVAPPPDAPVGEENPLPAPVEAPVSPGNAGEPTPAVP